MNVPTLGSTVRVTTKRRNSYLPTCPTEPFEFRTYEGTVVPGDKYDRPNTFCMTGDKRMKVRCISMVDVDKIEMIKGNFQSSSLVDLKAYKVKSKKTGSTYTVVIQSNKYSCTCTGFTFRRTCKHVKEVQKKCLKV